MSVAYVGQSQAKPGESEKLRDFFLSVAAPAVRAFEGANRSRYYRARSRGYASARIINFADPSSFMAIEIWASVEAHQASVKHISPEKHCRFHATRHCSSSWWLPSRLVMRRPPTVTSRSTRHAGTGLLSRKRGLAAGRLNLASLASRKSSDEVLDVFPNSLLFLRTIAHSSRRRTTRRWHLSLPRLPAKDRQCLRSTGQLLCSVQSLRYRHRIRSCWGSRSQVHIQVLPSLWDDGLPYRRRSQ